MPTAVPAGTLPGAPDRLHATCPSCGADRATFERRLRDHMGPESFAVARCAACDTRYVQDPPSAAAIGAYYETSAGAAMHREPGRLFAALRDRRIASDLRPLLERLRVGDGVADLGTGDGSVARHLHSRGLRAVGFDVFGADAWPHAEIPYRTLDLAAGTPSPDELRAAGALRGAVMRHVLEHVHRPAEVLEALREAGVEHVLVIVPNAGSRLARRFGEGWYYWDPPRHLTFFDPETLATCAAAAGLRVGFSRTYGLDEVATSAHRALLLRGTPRARRAAGVLRPTGLVAGGLSVLSAPVLDSVVHAVLDPA